MAEKKKKICPLTYHVLTHHVSNFGECREIECAWWFASKCSILQIAEILYQVSKEGK